MHIPDMKSQKVSLVFLALSVALCAGIKSETRCPDSSDDGSSYSSSSEEVKPPQCKDPNQVWSDCASVCPRTCANWQDNFRCLACKPGCECRGNLVLNDKNRCVPISQCPEPVCKDKNRYFTECGTACPRSCKNYWRSDEVCTEQCVEGCFCNPGLVEDGNGNCVEPSTCPPPVCDDENREYQSCGSACPAKCPNISNPRGVCTLQCVSGCFCKSPLVEDANGKCIQPSDCPKKCSDPNKIYEECGTACPRSCDKLLINYLCIDLCVPGCFCKDGLVLDNNDKCIPPSDCNSCKDPNKEYKECGSACPKTCTNWRDYETLPCTKQCVQGCFCKDGFVDDGNGNCVTTEQCSPFECKDPNRVYIECGSSCPDDCTNINQPDRVCPAVCVSKCFCRYPLVEDGKGNCIERTECPNKTCKDPNQYYSDCTSLCEPTCTNRCDPPFCPALCREGCKCLPGLIGDGYGNCIYPDDCPKDACKCPGNAEYTWGTCDGSCDNPDPICVQSITQQCFCRSGEVRNSNQVCIPKETCPK